MFMRRRRFAWVALALVPACAKESDSLEAGRLAPTAEQSAALEALEAQSGGAWRAAFEARTGTPWHLEGHLAGALPAGTKPSQAALTFLSTHKQIFRMN